MWDCESLKIKQKKSWVLREIKEQTKVSHSEWNNSLSHRLERLKNFETKTL